MKVFLAVSWGFIALSSSDGAAYLAYRLLQEKAIRVKWSTE
jgi:hypothetical protein